MRHDRIMDVHHTYADWEAAGISPPPLDWPSPAAPPPVARRGAGRRFGTAVAAVLLTAGVVVGCAHGGTKVVEGKATAAAASDVVSSTVPPDQVVHQWDTRTLPCANPDFTKGPPVNRFGIVPDGTYPYADDIRTQLQDLTAVGGPEFVADRIQHLNVVLVLTESDMTVEDRDGSRNVDRANKDKVLEAQAVRQAQQMLAVQKLQYDNAVKNTLDQLRNGPDFQVPADGFADSRMCH